MNIKLNEEYRITSDGVRNITLQKMTYIKNIETGELEPTGKYKDIGYYGKLEHCLDGILDREIVVSNATTLNELIEVIKTVRKEIKTLEIKIVKGRGSKDE